jgi:hypothetical protein
MAYTIEASNYGFKYSILDLTHHTTRLPWPHVHRFDLILVIEGTHRNTLVWNTSTINILVSSLRTFILGSIKLDNCTLNINQILVI